VRSGLGRILKPACTGGSAVRVKRSRPGDVTGLNLVTPTDLWNTPDDLMAGDDRVTVGMNSLHSLRTNGDRMADAAEQNLDLNIVFDCIAPRDLLCWKGRGRLGSGVSFCLYMDFAL